jgi:hypothetical protein
MDIAHWEFIGLLFGLALASIEMSGWKMTYLRHGIGIIGVLLAGACIVLLFGFSGATLRSPVSFRWPVVLPSDKPLPAPLPVARSQISQLAAPTPAYLAELASLKDENAKLKTENSRLAKLKAPRVVRAASPIPSACPSIAQTVCPSRLDPADCDNLTGAQRSVDIAEQQRDEYLARVGTEKFTSNDQVLQETRQAYTIKATQEQAIANLQGWQSRLCAQAQTASPIPTGH